MASLKSSKRAKELLQIHAKYGDKFRPVHLGACWNRLGAMAPVLKPEALGIDSLRGRTVLMLPKLRARQLANIAHAMSKLDLPKHGPWATAWTKLKLRISSNVKELNPQELAMVASAFAEAQDPPRDLFKAIATCAAQQLVKFNAKALANTALAFANCGVQAPDLFHAIEGQASSRINEFNAQDLATTARAFAKLGYSAPSFFKLVEAHASSRLETFIPHELAMIAWAFAKAEVPAPDLFKGIETRASSRPVKFRARELAMTAWAFAKAEVPAQDIFKAIATCASSRLGDFGAQELANTAWAFAKAKVPAPDLFKSIASRALICLDEFNAQELANTAWAFAQAEIAAPQLFKAIDRRALLASESFNAQNLANIAWAFAKANVPALDLFKAVGRQAASRLEEFSAQGLAMMAWAFATAQVPAPHLFKAIAAHSASRLEDFSGQDIANMVWAFAKLEAPAPKLFKAIEGHSAPRLHEFDVQAIAMIGWAFAKVEVPAPNLFKAIDRRASSRVKEFHAQGLAMTAWALAKAEIPAPDFFNAIAKYASSRLEEFSAQYLAMTAWALAKVETLALDPVDATNKRGSSLPGEIIARGFTMAPWQEFMLKLAAAASLRIEEFGPEELIDFVWAYEKAAVKEDSWEQAASSSHLRNFSFPAIGAHVALRVQVPSRLVQVEQGSFQAGTIGGRYRSGMHVFQASHVLAEFLSRHEELMMVPEVRELMGENDTRWTSWKSLNGIELGAGQGLPSIVASRMGANMVATDGDDEVLRLLSLNMQSNAPSCQVKKLFWSEADPLAGSGLKQKPDFIMAAGVVYDPNAWNALLHTIKTLSGNGTLVMIADQRRPDLDPGPFYDALSSSFEMISLSNSLLQPAFRRHGVNSLSIRLLRRKRLEDDASGSPTSRRHSLSTAQAWHASLKEAVEKIGAQTAKNDKQIVSPVSSPGKPSDGTEAGHVATMEGPDTAADDQLADFERVKRELDSALRKLRRKLKEHTNGGKLQELYNVFRLSDRNNDGELDSGEFLWVVRNVLKLSEREANNDTVYNLFDVLDENDTGTIDIKELYNFVLGQQVPWERVENPIRASPSILSPKSGGRRRLDEMFYNHKKHLDKLQAKREAYAEDEMRKIEQQKQRAKAEGSKYRIKKSVNPTAAGSRLYQDYFNNCSRLREKQLYYEQETRTSIENSKRKNMPTRSRSTPGLDGYEVCQRLYDDAERRKQDMQAAHEEHQQAEMAKFAPPPRRSLTNSTRHEDLYSEATARKVRQELKQRQAHEAQRRELAEKSIPGTMSDGGVRQFNADRVQELHNELAEKQRRLAQARIDKEAKEMEAIANSRPCMSAASQAMEVRRRPKLWECAVEDKKPVENSALETRRFRAKPKKPLEDAKKKAIGPGTQAHHSIKAIVHTVKSRCGITSSNNESLLDKEHQGLAKSLNAAMRVYREALRNCEASEGFLILCSRASQRLCQEHLLPEFEGWNRCTEPDPVRQVEDGLEDLMGSAAKAQELLKRTIAGNDWTQGVVCSHPCGVPIALFAHDPGLKTLESARAKAVVRYGPTEGSMCYRHITDLSRLLLVFKTCEMLMAGLDQIVRRFEVVDVRNFFANPGRLGVRYVEVLVVVQVNGSNGLYPHVCELRLEELCFHKAQEVCAPIMRKVYESFRTLYSNSGRNEDAIIHLVNTLLSKPPPCRGLRVFKSQLARRFGSTVCAWRRLLGGGRMLEFQAFRTVCHELKCGEHATEYWSRLDPTLAGKISLFDLDPDAVSLLIKVHVRMLALAEHSAGQPADASALFARMAFVVRPNKPGHLQFHEFRVVAKPMGLTQEEADKVFGYLDYYGGTHHAPPATITVTDIAWLLKLPSLVDFAAIAMADQQYASGEEALKHLSWECGKAKYMKRGELLRWSSGQRGGEQLALSCPKSRTASGSPMSPSIPRQEGMALSSESPSDLHGGSGEPPSEAAREIIPSASERLSLQPGPRLSSQPKPALAAADEPALVERVPPFHKETRGVVSSASECLSFQPEPKLSLPPTPTPDLTTDRVGAKEGSALAATHVATTRASATIAKDEAIARATGQLATISKDTRASSLPAATQRTEPAEAEVEEEDEGDGEGEEEEAYEEGEEEEGLEEEEMDDEFDDDQTF